MRGDTCIIGRAGIIFRADEIIFLWGERRDGFAFAGLAAGRKLAKFNVAFGGFNVFFTRNYVKAAKFLVKPGGKYVKAGGKYAKVAEFLVLFGEFNNKIWKKDEKAARFLVVLGWNGAKGLLFCVADARVRIVALRSGVFLCEFRF